MAWSAWLTDMFKRFKEDGMAKANERFIESTYYQYSGRRLSKLLLKLSIDTAVDLSKDSFMYMLQRRVERKWLAKELKVNEQEIKNRKTKQRS